MISILLMCLVLGKVYLVYPISTLFSFLQYNDFIAALQNIPYFYSLTQQFLGIREVNGFEFESLQLRIK